jgi:hypothetical protein
LSRIAVSTAYSPTRRCFTYGRRLRAAPVRPAPGDHAAHFLGGTFYSIGVLPPAWQTVTLFNPVVYLIGGFRWAFFEIADVHVGVSLGMTAIFLVVCLGTVWWIFRTGYRLKT